MIIDCFERWLMVLRSSLMKCLHNWIIISGLVLLSHHHLPDMVHKHGKTHLPVVNYHPFVWTWKVQKHLTKTLNFSCYRYTRRGVKLQINKNRNNSFFRIYLSFSFNTPEEQQTTNCTFQIWAAFLSLYFD